ncbi:MAG: (2Fe-2S)-binding protein [Oscillospiraceae bacterium]|nr:(2Fe-2S)-binding protein [Oscillospiraceae bacterium]
MDLNETICFCAGVTAGQIKEAVEAGNTTLEAVQEATGAGTHCGGCKDRVAELVEQFKG